MEGNLIPSTVWLPTFFEMYYFVFSRRKKFTQVWNNFAFLGELSI